MFRPCIDLHEGKVKQIVGGSWSEESSHIRTHFVSERSSDWFARRYRQDGLVGGHVIMLGPGNEPAALAALRAYPGGLQIGGGVRPETASQYLAAGASHVIVTSYVFDEGRLDWERLRKLADVVDRTRLVLDLSCRRRGGDYIVMTDRWQHYTELVLSAECFAKLGEHCGEFLVHAVDVEGLCRGVDLDLVRHLADWSPLPVTYAGGARSLADLEDVTREGKGRVDLTIGTALDIFGGTGVRYEDAVAFNRMQNKRG